MEALEMARRTLETFLATPILISEDRQRDLALFQQRHCFDAGLQPTHTADWLSAFSENMDRVTIYELHEPFDVRDILFLLDDRLVVIGPFTEMDWDLAQGEHVLSSLGLSASYLNAYKLYRCQYSVVEPKHALKAAHTLLEAAGKLVADYGVERIFLKEARREGPIQISEQYTYEHVNRRYTHEREFIEAIKAGDTDEALAVYDRMTALGRVPHMRMDNYTAAVGSSILRTTIRIAALYAGLPPLVIDSISQEYAQKLNTLGRMVDEKRGRILSRDLIVDMCREIRRQNMAEYSGIVRKAVTYIQLNLGHDLSVTSIAEELGVSPGYLSKRFKAETGEPITKAIMQQRSRKAAELLATTKHPVQDISNYVGYVDSNYFVKVFKAGYGMTPTEYRKKNGL